MPPSPPPEMPEDQAAMAVLEQQFKRAKASIISRTRGRLGEVMAATLIPPAQRDAVIYDRKCFETPFGQRRVDNFLEGTGEAIEAKMGRVVASSRTRRQIEKDLFLLNSGQIKRVTWLLYKGASRTALQLLVQAGIEIVDGWNGLEQISRAHARPQGSPNRAD